MLRWTQNSSEKGMRVHAIEQGSRQARVACPFRRQREAEGWSSLSLWDRTKSMCGRFTFQPTEEFYRRFNIANCLDGLVARYNIAPGQWCR